ncbi:MAG TPA: hypothetical protein VER04_28990 [Polyangiaceae bacterium]|nr:hypothetical protein [Polyangiaceae bacterium]
MARDVLILVPGLFGFRSFGSDPGQIAYFDHVSARIASFTGWSEEQILVHKPGPAEPLAWRVRSLAEAVERALAGRLPSLPAVDRVHLIGHSTGGVDVRLLVNSQYRWPGAAANAPFRSRIGAVVSLSGPHWGTPIARRLRGKLEDILPELYLASILAKHNRFPIVESLLFALFTVGIDPSKQPSTHVLRAMGQLPAGVANDVTRFLKRVVDDHGLIHDLTPLSMARLNRAVIAGECLRVKYYATAAPTPTLARVLNQGLKGGALSAAFYASAQRLTRPEPAERMSFPTGPWIGERGLGSQSLDEETNDGVVPTSSQTLHGAAAGLVQGDHLDVVGHYPSQRFQGNTLFKSGANFDDDRFDALWRAISKELTDV